MKKKEGNMKNIWTNRWKKALIWLCGYVSLIAYAIVGGYVIVKSEDEDLRRTAKTAFIVTLIFTAIDAFVSILSSIYGLSGYNQGFSEFLSWFRFVILIAEIAVYAVFILISLFGGEKEQTEASKAEKTTAEKADGSAKSEGVTGAKDENETKK